MAVEFNGGAADEVPTGDVDDDDDVDTGDAGDFGIFASMDDDSGDTQTYMDLCRNHVVSIHVEYFSYVVIDRFVGEVFVRGRPICTGNQSF